MLETKTSINSVPAQQFIVEQERLFKDTEAIVEANQLLQIRLDGISKSFGSTVANDNVSCVIQAGGIHAFLGENGAGKSTLMKILAGYYQPDAGSIFINDNQVMLKSPTEGRQLGIGMVHQQFTLVPSLTVLENVLLGHPSTPMILQRKKQAAAISEKARQYGIDLDLFSPVSRLNMAQRQKVEILKLLWRDARILILDEPTSQLAPFEAEEILQTMVNLSQLGKIVILITHHIEELLKFASVISVLREGCLVANFKAETVGAEELAQIMIGSDKDIPQCVSAIKIDTTRLLLKGVYLKNSGSNRSLDDINLEVKAGEVHGIAGVMGSGQDELASILSGQKIPERGQLFLDGNHCPWRQLQNPQKNFAYIPADPKTASLANLTLLENLLLRAIHQKEYLAGPFIKKEQVAQMTKERLDAFDVRPNHPGAFGHSLSGGNLQRLILSREFDKPASFMIAVNATAGLDLSMSLRIRQEFRQYVSTGRSVLLVSPDLDELLMTCDRISVMFAGRIIGTELVSNLNAQSLGLLLGGIELSLVRRLLDYLRNETSQADQATQIDLELQVAIKSLLESNSPWQQRLAADVFKRINA